MGGRIKILSSFSNPIFLCLAAVFLGHQLAQRIDLSTPFLRSYLDDFLALPLLFFFTTMVMRLVFNRPKLQLDWPMMLTGFILLVVVFEVVLPNYSTVYTRDGWDVVAYAAGGGLWLVWRRTI
jgi:hypothetical protein